MKYFGQLIPPPIGKIVYNKSDISFINIKKFVQKLKNQSFTGYIAFKSKKKHCYMLMEAGTPFNCAMCNGKNIFYGDTGFQRLLDAQEKGDGIVWAVQLKDKLFQIFKGIFHYKSMHNNVKDTDLIDTRKFIGHLLTNGHTGLVTIMIKGDQGIASLYMQKGKIIHFQLVNQNSKLIKFQGTLSEFLDYIKSKGAFIAIYKFQETKSVLSNIDLSEPEQDVTIELTVMKGFSTDTESIQIDTDILEQWQNKNLVNKQKPQGRILKEKTSRTVLLCKQDGMKNMVVISGGLISELNTSQGKKIQLKPVI